jgi:excisionase family DNA binding protein
MAQDPTKNLNVVLGDEIEPDESRTPAEFADEEMLTLEQVAHRMGCSATRVREWIASGMLTPVAEGSVERIRRSEVERIGNPDDQASREFEQDHA